MDLGYRFPAPDLDIDGAVEGPGVAATGVLEQEIPRQDAARVRRQRVQQVEFACRQGNFVPAGIQQAPCLVAAQSQRPRPARPGWACPGGRVQRRDRLSAAAWHVAQRMAMGCASRRSRGMASPQSTQMP